MIIRVQPGNKRLGFYTPWTRRLFVVLSSLSGRICNTREDIPERSCYGTEDAQEPLNKHYFEVSFSPRILVSYGIRSTNLERLLHDANSVVFIAGGSGISPVLSLLAAVPLDKVGLLDHIGLNMVFHSVA